MATIPLTDTIAHAVAQLVDDSNNNGAYRKPSHADIEFQVGFRPSSENFVGQESIANAKDAFAAEGFVLERMDSELRC